MVERLKMGLALLQPEMRWRWAGLIPLLLITAAAEAVGAAAVFVLIRIVADPASVVEIPVAAAIAAQLPRQDPKTIILVFTAFVASFYIAKNLLIAATVSVRSRCVSEATAALSQRMLRGYLTAPYSFHFHRNSAELIRNTDHSVERVFTHAMSPALSVISEALVTLGIVIVLLITAPFVTLVAGTLLLLLSISFIRLTRRRARQLGKELQALTHVGLQLVQQALGGIKELKVLGREAYFDRAYAQNRKSLVQVRYFHELLIALPRVMVETIFVCGSLFVIVLVTLRGRAGPDVISLLGLYAYAGFRIIPSINRILWHSTEIRYGTAALDQLYDDLITVTRNAEREKATEPAISPQPFQDELVLDKVSFTYEGNATPVLQSLDLVIRRGESIGIVGPTGAGKSTLVDVIVGLLEPTRGRLLVDGVDLRDCRSAWQHQIGYVPQAVFLVDDTIRRNIALALSDDEIEEDRVRRAAQRAQLGDLLASLPQGLSTVVGERGIRLSGGERQRVGIARALYHDPEVLVFDEATSALDNRTESEVTNAIESLHGDKTILLIAHRLTTVRRCDRLVFLLDGRIAGCGSFDELFTRNEAFRHMAAMRQEGAPQA